MMEINGCKSNTEVMQKVKQWLNKYTQEDALRPGG